MLWHAVLGVLFLPKPSGCCIGGWCYGWWRWQPRHVLLRVGAFDNESSYAVPCSNGRHKSVHFCRMSHRFVGGGVWIAFRGICVCTFPFELSQHRKVIRTLLWSGLCAGVVPGIVFWHSAAVSARALVPLAACPNKGSAGCLGHARDGSLPCFVCD